MRTGRGNEIASLAAAFVFIALFVAVLLASGISTSSAVGMQNSVIIAFLSDAPMQVIGPVVAAITAFAFLAAFFASLAAYGYFSDNRRVGIIAGIVAAAAVVAAFHSIVSLFLALGIFVASVFVVPMSNTYAKELKRWVTFRVGSKSVGKALMIVNVLLAAGLFISVSLSADAYRDDFRSGMKEAVVQATGSPDLAQLSPAQQAQARTINFTAQIEAQVDSALNTPFFLSYMRWLPVLSAVGVWIVLEFLKSVVFSNIAGAFTALALRIFSLSR